MPYTRRRRNAKRTTRGRRSAAPMPVKVVRSRQSAGAIYRKQKPLEMDSGLKQYGLDNNSTVLTMAPDPTSNPNTTSFYLHNMSIGDTYLQRESTTILNRFVRGVFSVTNAYSASRIFRIMIVGLRGSEASADTSSWSDLYVDSVLSKSGPTGQAGNALMRPNRDEYKVYYDKQYRIPGTADGIPNSRTIKLYKKFNTLTEFPYNSTAARSGSLYLVWTVFEEAGTARQLDVVNVNYRFTHYFQDVHRKA